MADIFLHIYNKTDSTSALNAPHRYRSVIYRGRYLDPKNYVDAWNFGKLKILNQFIETIKNNFDTTLPFAFSIAPSTTKIFINDIEAQVSKAFPEAVNFSNCFSKVDSFKAGETSELLTNEQLKNLITLNKNSFEHLITDDIQNILLLDDVYALGNTFKAMKLAIKNVDNTKNIFTAVLLKTQ